MSSAWKSKKRFLNHEDPQTATVQQQVSEEEEMQMKAENGATTGGREGNADEGRYGATTGGSGRNAAKSCTGSDKARGSKALTKRVCPTT